jgi:hypothetical protein
MHAARGYAPFHQSEEQDDVLAGAVAVAAAAPGQVAVFDLDGCLFDNRPRIVRIFHALASRHDLPDLLRVRPEHFASWDQRDTLRAAGLDEGRIAAVLPRFQRVFQHQFFSSAFCRFDDAMPGAARLVWEVYRAGASVVYLTGRHEEMRAGTLEALSDWGFPVQRPRTALLCKPDMGTDDTAFKDEALREIALLGVPVLFFDNEPANCNVFAARHPGARVVWVETDHSPRPDRVPAEMPRVRGFLRTTDAT